MDTDNTNDKDQEKADSASSISSDLIRGHINTIILRTLYDGDKYGYEIINEIEEKSKGQYSLKQPTLYSALKRLESQDYVTSYWGGATNGGRRKYFQITEKGKAVVEQNRAEWEYSRTVIDSLISERDYDFSNPPPAPSVDFNILKKSTSRVPVSYGDDDSDDIELPQGESFRDPQDSEDSSAASEEAALPPDQSQGSESLSAEQTREEVKQEEQFTRLQSEENIQNTDMQNTASVQESRVENQSAVYTQEAVADAPQASDKPVEPQPLTEDEKNRIHENYKALIGEETDATSYYYAQVAREKAAAPKQEEEQPGPYAQDMYAQPYAEPYPAQDPYAENRQPHAPQDYPQGYPQEVYQDENRAISSELLYSNKSPAERNYKKLLNKLYDNTHKHQDEEYYEDERAYTEDIPAPPEETPPPAPEPATTAPAREMQAQAQAAPAGNTASNIEFYDVEEKAQKEGLRITTTNGSRNRTMAKSVGNTFDKGRALFLTAVYVFIVALAESIINHCLHNVFSANALYIVIPYVLAFVMLGVFLFLFLNGYGKNSRKTQSKSYLSASFVIFVNIVLIIVVIAYLVIYFGNADLSMGIQILKYAIFPIVYAFNLPLFALLYRVNSNKQ